MRKLLTLICISFGLLVGFENAEDLEITDVQITVIEENDELRYDFEIKNNGDKPIKSEFDYPGHHPYGIEPVVIPNEKLAKHMVMEENTTFHKMRSLGGGSRGYFEANSESYIHLSYLIKEDVDLEKVKELALDSNLLILDGVDVSAEFPLKNMK